MKPVQAAAATYQPWPRWWRMVVVALCTLILCSCRGPRQAGPVASGPMGGPPALPREAYAGTPVQPGEAMAAAAIGPPGMEAGVPLPYAVMGPWAPPGMHQPWPADEYLADGGDSGSQVTVASDWQVRGLELEDTVAHFDTLDGRTVVEPSNRVHIYSPRFGAVRRVVSLKQNEQRNHASGIHKPTQLVRCDDLRRPQTRQQQVQAEGQTGLKLANIYRTRQGDGVISSALGPGGFDNAFKPHEAPSMIRLGIFEASEMAWLAEGVDAALAWSHEQSVQVVLDHQTATAQVGAQRLQSVFTVRPLPTSPELRIIKVASTQLAQPGEEVDFTLRFDNTGDETIGNVVIIDNLTTRLEYLPDSAQCSLPARFLTQPNEGDSLALRWEISDPLKPGEGGIIRFRCRVR